MFHRKFVNRILLGLMALMAAATSSEATGPEGPFLGVPATKLFASGHGSRVLASSRTSAEEANRPTVAVLVYNYAHIPAEKMADSSERVARIFREAGIDIEWMNPLADHTLIVSPTSNSLMRFTVQMLIRPRRWPPQIGPSTDSVMGIAFPAAANGGTLWLFYEQILHVARGYHQPLEDILALAMAHEIGHLLLPYPSHSVIGVMAAEWDREGLKAIAGGSLQFTPAQASAMRAAALGCCAATTGHGSR